MGEHNTDPFAMRPETRALDAQDPDLLAIVYDAVIIATHLHYAGNGDVAATTGQIAEVARLTPDDTDYFLLVLEQNGWVYRLDGRWAHMPPDTTKLRGLGRFGRGQRR